MNSSAIEVQIKSDNRGLLRGFNEASLAVRNFGSVVGTVHKFVSNKFYSLEAQVKSIGHKIAGLTVGLGLSLGGMSKFAGDFEESMRNVNTITKLNESDFKALSKTIEGLADGRVSAKQLADGLYDIASAGFDASESLEIVKASATAATGGLTDIKTAGDAITSVLNAYSLGAGQATETSDILFKTVELGKITFEQLAAGTGQWVAVSAAAGINAREAGAAIATLTAHGFDAAEAGTALVSAVRGFLAPSDAMKQKVKELGYTSALAMVQHLGFARTIEVLSKSVHGQADAMRELFQDAQGLAGVLSLTSGGASDYNMILKQMNDRAGTAGAALRAASENSKGFNASLADLRTEAGKFSIGIGKYVIVPLGFIASHAASAVHALNQMPEALKAMLGVGAVLLTLFGGLVSWFLVSVVKTTLLKASITLLNAALVRLGFTFQIPMFRGFINGAAQGVSWLLKFIGVEVSATAITRGLFIGLGTIGVALAAGAIAWNLYGSAIARGRNEAKATLDELAKGRNLQTLGGLKRQIEDARDLAGAYAQADHAQSGFFNRLHAGEQAINPFEANSIIENQGKFKQTSEDFAKYQQAILTLDYNLYVLGEDTGKTKAQIYTLAESLGIDLTVKSDRALKAIVATFKQMEYGQVSAKGLSEQIKALAKNTLDFANEATKASHREQGIQSIFKGMVDINNTTNDATQANLSLKQAQLGVAQSVQQEADAAKKLKELRDPADILKVRDAEIALKDAQLGVRDAQRSLAQAQRHAALVSQAGRSAEEVAAANDDVVRAQIRVDQSTKSVTDREKDLATARHEGIQYQTDLTTAQLNYESAVLSTKAAEKELEDQRERQRTGSSGTSAKDALNNLKAGTGRVQQYSDDISNITERAGIKVANYLIEQGPEAANLVHAMAAATGPEFERMKGIVEGAMKATGDAAVTALDLKLQVLAAKGKLGAKATVDGIAKELGLLPKQVEYIGEKIWPGLLAGIAKGAVEVNTFLSGTQKGTLKGPYSANKLGNQPYTNQEGVPYDLQAPKQNAYGGIYDKLTYGTFGESGEEALIPLTKRTGHAILAKTANKMGYSLKAKDAGYSRHAADRGGVTTIVVEVPAPAASKTSINVEKIVGVDFKDAIKQSRRAARKKATAKTGQGGWGQ